MKEISKSIIIAMAMSFVFVACRQRRKESRTFNCRHHHRYDDLSDTTSQTQDMDAAKVAPALYKVVKDSLGIRFSTFYINRGMSSAMHSHPTQVLYVIDGGKGDSRTKTGQKILWNLSPA